MNPQAPDIHTERSFPAREADLHDIVNHVETCAAALGLPHSLRLRLCLVVEELFVNTAKYGGSAAAVAEVAITSDAAGVYLHYADTAAPFNSLEALAREELSRTTEERRVGGMGRILVCDLSAGASYERIGARNVLRLRFELDSAS